MVTSACSRSLHGCLACPFLLFEMFWTCSSLAEEVQMLVAGPWEIGVCDVDAYALALMCFRHQLL